MSELRIEAVTYRYGRRFALRNFSHTFPAGVTVVLGPNGAGKSTLLKLCALLLRPAAGTVHVPATVEGEQTTIGYLPQSPALVPSFTCSEFVAYCLWMRGASSKESLDQSAAVLASVGLSGRADDRISSLSGGMKRRLAVGSAIGTNAAMLLLDEPMAGLDPEQRGDIRMLIRRVAAGLPTLVATHILQDLPGLADYVLLLRDGDIVFSGDLAAFANIKSSEQPTLEQLEERYNSLVSSSS